MSDEDANDEWEKKMGGREWVQGPSRGGLSWCRDADSAQDPRMGMREEARKGRDFTMGMEDDECK